MVQVKRASPLNLRGQGNHSKLDTKLLRKLVGTKRTHAAMSEGGSQDDEGSNKEADSDSILDEPYNRKPKLFLTY